MVLPFFTLKWYFLFHAVFMVRHQTHSPGYMYLNNWYGLPSWFIVRKGVSISPLQNHPPITRISPISSNPPSPHLTHKLVIPSFPVFLIYRNATVKCKFNKYYQCKTTDTFHIRNWLKQWILSNLPDGNSLKVLSIFQYYPQP